MEFNNVKTIKYPLPLAWATLRDHLPDIAAAQPDIEYVHVEKRAQKPDGVSVLSTWKANPPLPSFLKGFIKPDMLIWTDDALWQNPTTTCHFTITTRYQIEEIHCTGTIAFKTARGNATTITYSGRLTIKRTARSSIFVTGFIIKGIESVAATIIAHNFGKVVNALETTLAQKAKN